MGSVSTTKLQSAYQKALDLLLAERHPDGYWIGELSTSALSTATAVGALSLVRKQTNNREYDALIENGAAWLAAHQNDDGGWGDTTISISNISTTMLCRAAFHLSGTASHHKNILEKAHQWLAERYGKTAPEHAEAVRQRYGKDRTFAVPILTTCALAGLVEWRETPPLPFELAVFPQSWFRFLRLHVVSYALPALIAIGQAVYHHRPPWNPFARMIRWLSKSRSMKVLRNIQPSSGGFLEATPLTSFVVMSLASIGKHNHPVTREGVRFLVSSVRNDGSWPIDTNLSTWVTTLAVNALAGLEKLEKKPELVDWLIEQQYRVRHPYTGAAPGGWAWTPLPGGVPDADDTPGAIIALANLSENDPRIADTLDNGIRWLLALQNTDGGTPTFCKGWGHLPFDRSGTDLTAHALRALRRTKGLIDPHIDIEKPMATGLAYLQKTQRPDGSWLPLWFGNQFAPDDENPTYGTARVLAVYRDLHIMNTEPAQKGIRWLLDNQNADGGWGGGDGTPSTIEETALALDVLADAGETAKAAVNKGATWLVEQVEVDGLRNPTPIGFYFAKLWYFEKLYPIIFTVGALGRVLRARSGSL